MITNEEINRRAKDLCAALCNWEDMTTDDAVRLLRKTIKLVKEKAK